MCDMQILYDGDPRWGQIVAGPWVTALLMMEYYGEGALAEAAGRADDRLDAGDLGAAESWLQVVDCIEEVLAARPAAGEAVH